MYSTETINNIANLVGFGPSAGVNVSVTEENMTGTSLRSFPSFHRSVTLKNIYSTVEAEHLLESDFNAYLNQARLDAALNVLISVIDSNPNHQSDVDYSGVIQDNISSFQECMGLSLCSSILEMMMVSTRSNLNERTASLGYSKLKIELDGAKNDNGHILTFGLRSKFRKCCNDLSDIIFPNYAEVESGESW